jgi:hypothetical protein
VSPEVAGSVIDQTETRAELSVDYVKKNLWSRQTS